jgi:hypothetical protein
MKTAIMEIRLQISKDLWSPSAERNTLQFAGSRAFAAARKVKKANKSPSITGYIKINLANALPLRALGK